MANVDRKDANLKKLNEAAQLQDKTKEAIWRIQRQAAEAEELGTQTLDELRRQGQQMDDINSELESVGGKLDQSMALQTKFDAWAGNWFGGKKRSAMKEAQSEIKERNKEDHSKIKEVFEHESKGFTGGWKKSGLYLCTDTSISCNELFDPETQEKVENSRWNVDFSLAGIDAEGWTYATNFSFLDKYGAGDSAPKWNYYSRRRKWRYVDRAAGSAGGMSEVTERNEARKERAAANAASRHTDKIGYVPRNKQAAAMNASGLTSAGMMGQGAGRNDPSQTLDEDSAAGLAKLREQDAEIDAGIDQISRTIDNLTNIAGAMKDETVSQNQKLEKIDGTMQKATEKQTVVNARQRYLLK